MAKKAKAKKGKRAAKAQKVTAPKITAASVKAEVDALRAKVATGSKTEIDLVPATLAVISDKLDAIK